MIGQETRDWAEKNKISTIYLASTTSTNSLAKELIGQSSEPQLILTDHQTLGRGRHSNSWSEPPQAGSILLSSWIFPLSRAPQPVLAPALGAALWTAFQASFPQLPWGLKAPNDLYLAEKKIAGILLENVQQGSTHHLIIGLGFNVRHSPQQIPTAGCLEDFLGRALAVEEWQSALQRLWMEMKQAVLQATGKLSEQQQQTLLLALNRFPKTSQLYQKVDADGSLWIPTEKINWSSL